MITVHRVWTADPRWQSAPAALSEEESTRANRFVHARDRERFIASHQALRRAIAARASVVEREVRFELGPHGKPHFARVAFNMSHSGDLALIAIGSHGDVGVDVEQVTDRDVDLLAPTVFSIRELRALEAATDRRRAFFRGWARKEAFVKLLGIGVTGALSAFDVSLDSDVTDALVESRLAGAARARVVPIDVHSDYEAAVATTDLDARITIADLEP